MSRGWSTFLRKFGTFGHAKKQPRPGKALDFRRRLSVEQLEDRTVPSGVNPNQIVLSGLTPTQLAQSLVGPGVSVSNANFTGGAASTGSFTFADPTVVGFTQGIVLSSGSAADVVGPNLADWTSTDFGGAGDADLTALSGFPTFDAAVLEFDFTPTANQVVFQYAFASDEYPEWVNTGFNDVFAFYVNGTNYAVVRQVAGDPGAPFVPVAVNNINNGNPLDPSFVPMRPDLFRANYFDVNGGPSAIDLEQDGITSVLTFQAPVIPGVPNHMKLAIADASDGIYDSAVFIQAGSLVSNENPVADLSLAPESGAAPLTVTAIVEGEDPNWNPQDDPALSYTIDWGDGTSSAGLLAQPYGESEKTTLVDHTYAAAGQYIVTLTVSNGTLSGASTEDVHVSAVSGDLAVTLDPEDQTVVVGETFTFNAAATGQPTPTVQWQVSTDNGETFEDIPDATFLTYSGTASLEDTGNLYRAVFTNDSGSVTTNEAELLVAAQETNITVTGGTFTYDGLAHDAAATATGFDGEPLEGTFSFTYNGLGTAPVSAGIYAVVATFTSEDPVYVVTGFGSIIIKPATPDLAVVGGSYTYDTLTHAATATALSVDGVTPVAGTFSFTYDGATAAPDAAGTYVVVATFHSGDQNYADATVTSTLTITQATPTVAVTGGTFTFDGTPHAAVASVTGVNGEVLGPMIVTYSSLSDLPVNAGTYIVDVSFAGNGNYKPASGAATIVIDRATPTMTVIGGTFTYNGQPHPATVALVGVNGQALGPVVVTYNGSAQAPVNPGTYAVVASFAGTGNYNPVSGTANVVITQAQYTAPHGLAYWVLHPNAWDVSSLKLGGYTYNKAELYMLMLAPSFGDARIALAKQLIVAKLNLAHNSNPAPIQSVVTHADGLLAGRGKINFFSGRVQPGSSLGRQMLQDAALLEDYNT